jgi:hypothetical protein
LTLFSRFFAFALSFLLSRSLPIICAGEIK